jgi:hypothetical protein
MPVVGVGQNVKRRARSLPHKTVGIQTQTASGERAPRVRVGTDVGTREPELKHKLFIACIK